MKKDATSRGIALTLSAAVLIALAVGCAPPEITSAKLYMNSQNYTGARETLEKAVALYPENAEVHRIFGDLEAMEKNWPEAKRHYDLARGLSPIQKVAVDQLLEGYWQQFYNDGYAFIQRQDYEEAIISTTNATIMIPERASAWTNLGAIYGNMGEYEMAVEMYSKVLEYDPGNTMARQNIGFMRYNALDYAEAVRFLEPLTEEYISDPGFVQILGLSYGYLERRGEALALYERAIELDPDNLVNHMNLAVLYVQQGEHDKAEPHYLRVIELNPFDVEAMLQLADALLKREDEDNASIYLEKAMELDPGNSAVLRQLGVYYIRRGARLENIEDIQRGQELMARAEQIDSLMGGDPPPAR
ncbi:tetratricopeptide repeat protein [Gemmatimonadota bacterium]